MPGSGVGAAGGATGVPVPVTEQAVDMVLLSSTTSPVSATTPPHPTDAPVLRVSEASEITLPRNAVLVPRVVEVPTSQFMPPV